MGAHSRYRAGLWLTDEKPMYGAQPILGHPLTPTAAWIMNEGSGNKVFDLINGNHGTFGAGVATPSWVAGRSGPALDFGGNDYVVAGTSIIEFPLTISAWFKTDVVDGSAAIAGLNVASDTTGYITLHRNGNKLHYAIRGGTGWAYDDGTTILAVDTWYHAVLVVHDDTIRSMYLNGVEETMANGVGNVSATFAAGIDSALIGLLRQTSPVAYFDGAIDNVTMYNRALSETWQLHIDAYCWLAHPLQAELMYAPPAVGAVMNQFQRTNLGADLYDGVLIT